MSHQECFLSKYRISRPSQLNVAVEPQTYSGFWNCLPKRISINHTANWCCLSYPRIKPYDCQLKRSWRLQNLLIVVCFCSVFECDCQSDGFVICTNRQGSKLSDTSTDWLTEYVLKPLLFNTTFWTLSADQRFLYVSSLAANGLSSIW